MKYLSTMAVMAVSAAPVNAIADYPAPQAAAAAATGSGTWALINLILTVGIGIGSLLMIIVNFKRRREDASETDPNRVEVISRRRFLRTLTLIPAIAALNMFLVTEDMNLPMVLTDKWTILMAAIVLIQVILMGCARDRKEEESAEVQA